MASASKLAGPDGPAIRLLSRLASPTIAITGPGTMIMKAMAAEAVKPSSCVPTVAPAPSANAPGTGLSHLSGSVAV